MPKISLAAVLNIFRPGATPSVTDWTNIFQSFIHIDNQTAVNSQSIDQKISAYDSNLRSRPGQGAATSLGDLLSMVNGYGPTTILKNVIDAVTNAAKWANLPGKPANVPLQWTEQIVTVAANGSFQGTFSQQWLAATSNPAIGGTYVISDIQITRRANSNGGFADEITAIKYAVLPNAKLNG